MSRRPDDWKNGERDKRLRKEYGISEREYDAILEEQGGGCAICGKAPGKRAHAVDHCHKDGHVRGILCWTCNATLGKIEAIGIHLFAGYLDRNGARSPTIREVYFGAFPHPPEPVDDWTGLPLDDEAGA